MNIPLYQLSFFFRFLTEKQLNHQSWFLFYPEEGNKRGAPTQLLRGVEFGIETKALLFKRLCAYAGLHCDVVKGYSKSTEYLPGEEFVDTRYVQIIAQTAISNVYHNHYHFHSQNSSA